MSRRTAADAWLGAADRAGRFAENAALVTILGGMILLGAAQIVLRNFFGGGFAWADEALRLMVLWIAMLGAVAASREDRHIAIDILSRFLSPGPRRWAALVVDLFTAAVAGTLAWYSWLFVRDAWRFDDVLLDDLPAWLFQAILPVGFALISWRYLVWALRRATGREAPPS